MPDPRKERDLRLDLFRGLALWLIFLDHMPSNIVNWLTIRNYGFSDAAEVFVFISGYTAALVYGSAMRSRGFVIGAARVLRRCWQLYIAHIFLFVVFMAEIAYTAARFENPMFVEEMNIVHFLDNPPVTLVQALLLKFRPANLDILPLYIVLLLSFPAVLWALMRRPWTVLAASAALYIAVPVFGWNLESYPPGTEWLFNPFAWQFLFVIGASCRLGLNGLVARARASRLAAPLSATYLLFAFAVAMSWHIPQLGPYMPNWLGDLIYPISKTNLDPLRLAHFLALACLVTLWLPSDGRILRWRLMRPAIWCGQQALIVFCLGIFLSFAGHFVLVEIDGSVGMQIAVAVGGIALMTGTARMLILYRDLERAGAARGEPGGQE